MKKTIFLKQEINNGGAFGGLPIDNSFDVSLITDFNIMNAEKRFLTQNCLISKTMYKDMIDKRNTQPSQYNPDLTPVVAKFPTNADYEALWVFGLRDYLLHCTLYESFYNIVYGVGSGGIFLNDSQTGQNAGLAALKATKNNLLGQIQTFEETLIEYLDDNADKYPLRYDDVCTECNHKKELCKCSSSRAKIMIFKA